MAKGKKTGGRKAGTPNKKNSYTEDLLAEYKGRGKSPLQFLMDTMNRPQPMAGFTPAEWFKLRFEAAAKAAPYYHAKLITQKVEMGGHGGGPIEHNHRGGVLLADKPMALDDWMAKYGSGEAPVRDDDGDGDEE